MFGPTASSSGEPLRVTVLGPPLRLPPLLALPFPTVALAFTDDPAECAAADVVLLSDPPDGDVLEVGGHAPVLVIVPRRCPGRRLGRLYRAGADLCLRDPERGELAAGLARLTVGGRSASRRGEA